MEKKAIKNTIVFSVICILCATLVMIIYMIERSKEKETEETEEIATPDNKAELGCPFLHITNDGYCDDEANIEECNYDFDDCCHWENDFSLCQDCFCKTPPINYSINYFQKMLDLEIIYLTFGDGKCDVLLNTQEYFFDAGDCCYDQSSVCIKSDRYCIEDQIGDGICQDHNNSPLCNYDLGDCCSPNINTDFCWICTCRTETWIPGNSQLGTFPPPFEIPIVG